MGIPHSAALQLWVHYFGFLFSLTMMNRLFNNKRKKSSRPDTFTRIPTNVPAGPVSYQADSNIGPEGWCSLSYQDLATNRPDPIVALVDEGNSEGPRTVLQDMVDEGQELPAPEAWISSVVIGGTEHGQNPTSKCFRFL